MGISAELASSARGLGIEKFGESLRILEHREMAARDLDGIDAEQFRMNRTQEVAGSSPASSTIKRPPKGGSFSHTPVGGPGWPRRMMLLVGSSRRVHSSPTRPCQRRHRLPLPESFWRCRSC